MFAGIIAYIIINSLIVPVFAHLVSPLGGIMTIVTRYATLLLSEVFVLKFLYKQMIKDNNETAMISAGIGMGFFEVLLTAFQTILMLGIYLLSIQNGTIEPTLVTMGYSTEEINALITSITSMSYGYLFSFSLLAIVTMTTHIISAYMLSKLYKPTRILIPVSILFALNVFIPYFGFEIYLICFVAIMSGLIFVVNKKNEFAFNEGGKNGRKS